MSRGLPEDVAIMCATLVADLTDEDVMELAESTLLGADDLQRFRMHASRSPARGAAARIINLLSAGADSTLVAGMLLGARAAGVRESQEDRIDIVWTGPPSRVRTSRLTSAAVLEAISGARDEILLVSYATYPPPDLDREIRAATERGVRVTVLLERSEDNPGLSPHGAAFPGTQLVRLAWPRSQRSGPASLHAKILVVDRRWGLVGSANFTGRAFDMNLECGVLIHSAVADEIVRHVMSLVDEGVLVRI